MEVMVYFVLDASFHKNLFEFCCSCAVRVFVGNG